MGLVGNILKLRENFPGPKARENPFKVNRKLLMVRRVLLRVGSILLSVRRILRNVVRILLMARIMQCPRIIDTLRLREYFSRLEWYFSELEEYVLGCKEYTSQGQRILPGEEGPFQG